MRAAKRDISEPAIVKALEQAGCMVYRQLPCDLLVFSRGRWFVMECKTRIGKRAPKMRQRKDQPDQAEFCKLTSTPYVTTPEEALAALGMQS